MTFLLRAALVIGALSYLAMMRDRPGTPTGGPGLGSLVVAVQDALPASIKGSPTVPARDGATLDTLSAVWTAMPSDTRQGIAQGAVAELGRRMAPTPAVSQDTLAETDRRATWRGGEGR